MSELNQSSVNLLERAIDDKIRKAVRGGQSTHLATVTRISNDGTTWVRVYGGAEETPVRRMTTDAQVGDVINVTFSGLSCMGVGNVSSPSATSKQVQVVSRESAQAAESAERAYNVANNAESDAMRARSAADSAMAEASAAHTAAGLAQSAAESAQSSADAAQTAAENAQSSADAASSAAAAAQRDATDAKDSAATANRAANSALTELSIVEDVAGTLKWIQDHGNFTATADTSVQDGKVYFAYNSETHDYEPVVSPAEGADPHALGWFELDVTDSQTDFIMAHLAVTTRGLWVLPSGMGSSTTPASGESQADSDARQGANYKLLLSNDGTYVYDGTGALVIKYGANIEPSIDRPFYIGDPNSTSYILFTPASGGNPAHISIGGSVTIGSFKTLSELLADTQAAVQTANDVPIVTLSSTNGTVFKRNLGVDTTIVATIYTPGGRIDNATELHNRFGNGAYLEWGWRDVVTEAEHVIISTDPRIGNGGFTFTVSPEDIDVQAVITCSLNY